MVYIKKFAKKCHFEKNSNYFQVILLFKSINYNVFKVLLGTFAVKGAKEVVDNA
jgi:hypothetical protein